MKVTLLDVLKQKGITQYQLSKTTGMTLPNINNLCNGKTSGIKFDKLEKICNALNCTPNDILLCDKDDE